MTVLCPGCGLVYIFQHPSGVEEYYSSNEYSKDFRAGNEKPSPEKRLYDAERAQIRLDIIKDILPEGGRLLEIGCGSGALLSQLPDRFEKFGIELSTGYAESSREMGLNVMTGAFPKDKPEGLFDVILVFHTLEHVEDPIGFLRGVHDALADDGLFILGYPDLSQALERGRAVFQPSYFQKSHLWDFCHQNLVPPLMKIGLHPEGLFMGEGAFPLDKNAIFVLKKGEPQEVIQSKFFAQELYNKLAEVLGGD